MSTLVLWALNLHIFSGLLGLVCLSAVMTILPKKMPDFSWIRRYLMWGFWFFVGSWVSGGYYYSQYYGTSVKPVVQNSVFPLAHNIFMEAKEHIFLILPFLTLVLYMTLIANQDEIQNNPKMKRAVLILNFIALSIALFMVVSGTVISGAVGKR